MIICVAISYQCINNVLNIGMLDIIAP